MSSVLSTTSNFPFSGLPSSAYNSPLALTGFNGRNIPIAYIPSVRGQLFETPQYTKSEPPSPVYAYDINLSSAESPLGQKPSVSLSEQEKMFLEAILKRPDSTFTDRISTRDVLGANETTRRTEYTSVPVAAISDSLRTQETKIIVNQPSQDAFVVNAPPPPPPQKLRVTQEREAFDLPSGGADFVDELKMKLSEGGIKLKPASERTLAPKRAKKTGTKIVNPKTGREVLADGKIGREILKNLPEAPIGGFDINPVPKQEKEKEPSIEEKAQRRFSIKE